jgi:predicted amidophosphoribosyltransferase
MSKVIVSQNSNPTDVNRWAGNVVRKPGVTCVVCGEPTGYFGYCRHCGQHRKIPGAADVVAPVIYAVSGERSAALLRDFKDHPSQATRARDQQIVGALAEVALTRHSACVEALVGRPISVRTTLPSLTFRPGVHPFTQLVRDLGMGVEDLLIPAPTATCQRVVRPDKFEVAEGAAIAGRHVLVLDDVWTTGSNAQSAALTLRRAGAVAVSVLVIGRWINPSYPPSARFLEGRRSAGFDPDVCPVIDGECP